MTQLPDLPQNAAFLNLLRQWGVPHKPGGCDYAGWELHTHPYLVERLVDMLLVRLPKAPAASLDPARPCPPLTDPVGDWYSLDPWQNALPSAESKRLLSLVIKHALSYAASLSEDKSVDWRGRPVPAPRRRP